MGEYLILEHVFFVLSFFGVGLWTILRLGVPGINGSGVPFVPPELARGLWGRLLGGVLCICGAAFLAIAILALAQLVPRLR